MAKRQRLGMDEPMLFTVKDQSQLASVKSKASKPGMQELPPIKFSNQRM
jgi:hypothetical protein